MKKIFIHNLSFRLVSPPVYGILSYLLILMANDNINQIQENFFSHEVWLSIGITYLLFEIMRGVILLMDKIYPAKKNLRNRIIIQLIANTVVCLLVVSLVISLYFIYILGSHTFDIELITLNIIYLIFAILYNLLYIGFLYLSIRNEVKLEKEIKKRENLEYQLQAFNNEVNPKFLYESLETLIGLLQKSPEASENFVEKLSNVYRYVLDNKQNEFTEIQYELNAIENLIFVLNQKYLTNIHFKIDLDEKILQQKIVPGTLTKSIDYIVNHTIISNEQPLHITCFAEDDVEYLVLKSRLNERLLIDGINSDNLRNIQNTYSIFTDKPILEVKAYDDLFIKIPLININEEQVLSKF